MLGDSDAEDLLDDLQAALNKLAASGYPVTIRDGHLSCRAGDVVPSSRGRWASRPLVAALGRPFPSGYWPPWPLGEWTDKDGW